MVKKLADLYLQVRRQLLETEEPEQYIRPVDSMFRNYPAVTLTENPRAKVSYTVPGRP